MRVVAISCVKNEDDIIEAFVRYVTAFVDQLIVLDNGSTDETGGILCSLKNEGIPIEIVEDPSPGFWQWKRMTHLMEDYAVKRYGADWIIPLDADEYIATKDVGAFRSALATATQPLKIKWQTYVPDPSDNMNEINPVVRIRHRLVKEAKPWKKILVPRNALINRGNTVLSQGNHELLVDGKKCESLILDSAQLAHFPIRSPGQYGSKIALRYLQYLAMSEREKEWGSHLRSGYELLKNDPETFSDSYRDAALRFAVKPESDFDPKIVLDPIPYMNMGGTLRYTKMDSDKRRAFLSVINYAQSLAKSYSDLVSEHQKTVEKVEKLEKLTKKFRFLMRSVN